MLEIYYDDVSIVGKQSKCRSIINFYNEKIEEEKMIIAVIIICAQIFGIGGGNYSVFLP
jgi:hypothetical protein